MSVIKTEGKHAGEYLVSEAAGSRSREVVTVASGQNLTGCTVLGQITASKKYVALAPAAGDGSQNAAAILFDNTDATAGDKKQTAHVRDCEVNASDLVWGAANAGQIAAGRAQLALQGIIVRDAV